MDSIKEMKHLGFDSKPTYHKWSADNLLEGILSNQCSECTLPETPSDPLLTARTLTPTNNWLEVLNLFNTSNRYLVLGNLVDDAQNGVLNGKMSRMASDKSVRLDKDVCCYQRVASKSNALVVGDVCGSKMISGKDGDSEPNSENGLDMENYCWT